MIRKLKDGRYEVAVDQGRDATGKRLRIWRRAPTRLAAKSLEAQLIAERDTGTTIQPGRLTTGEFLARWLKDHCEVNLAPKSVLTYRQLIGTHILPYAGSIPLTGLKPLHVQGVYGKVQESGRSPRTALQVHRLLRVALRAAVRWQLLAHNPCDAVEAPRVPAVEMELPDAAGIRRLLTAADATRHGPMVRLTLESGLRLGEVCGLRWADLDLGAATLCVSQTVQWLPGGLVTKPPKTARSRRVVALSGSAVQTLRQHRVKQQEYRLRLGPVYKDNDLVFPSEIGTPLFPQGFYRAWKRITAEAGVTLKFHGLRHLSATTALAAGVDVRTIADRLGHSNTSTTLDIYAHAVAGADRAAAEAISAALRRTG